MFGFLTNLALSAVSFLAGQTRVAPGLARVLRARSMVGRGMYGLGSGGRDPHAASPFGEYQPRKGEAPDRIAARRALGRVWCDCSGFVAWVIGMARRLPGYARGWGYISTDGLIADANDPKRELVEWVRVGETVYPGDLLVYGAIDSDNDGDRDAIGHVAIVSHVPDGWVYTGPASLAALTIIHCASSKHPGGGAVRESLATAFAKRGGVLRVW